MRSSRVVRVWLAVLLVGVGAAACTPPPAVIPPLAAVTQFDAGAEHACALGAGGTVRCWGVDENGELGNVPLAVLGATSSNLAVEVTGLSGATQVAVGGGFSCALMVGGTVRCWGGNRVGQLGNGTTSVRSDVPVTVLGITDATAIRAGGGVACALLAAGTVKCWGDNGGGQLGNGTTSGPEPSGSAVPVDVVGVTGVTDLAVGWSHVCALVAGGAVKCWGYNIVGELGNGTTTNSSLAVDVVGISGATQISGVGAATCTLLAGGTAKCWGYNLEANLGDGTADNRSLPVDVVGLSGATQIAAGGNNTCALLAGGTATCWGANQFGQLGNGSIALVVPVPVDVSGLTGAVRLSVSGGRSCALLSGGTVSCWGRNLLGQMGDGTNVDSSTPEPVRTLA